MIRKLFLLLTVAVYMSIITSCEKKSKAEQLMEDIREETEKSAKKTGDAIEDAADKTEKESKTTSKKMKKLFK